jgi:predicted SnoaL-like aldol condensation-catalyzing enzyme
MTNKETIKHVYEVIFNRHNLNAAIDFMNEDYIQHNPHSETGRKGFIKFFETFFREKPDFKFEIKKMIAEGDLVVVHGQAEFAGNNVAVVDIYRLVNGKLAEHWDVIQPIPEKMEHNHYSSFDLISLVKDRFINFTSCKFFYLFQLLF